MKIIALIGESNCGKTTTLNIVYDNLILRGATVKTLKTKTRKGVKDDFEVVLSYKSKSIAIFSVGDYTGETIIAINKYDKLGVDVLICASNKKLKKPIKEIIKFSHEIVEKTKALSIALESIENQKDADEIESHI